MKRAKDELDVIFVWMIMFSFDMLNIKMILYEQNVMLRLSLIAFIFQWLEYNTYNAREFFLNNKPRSFKWITKKKLKNRICPVAMLHNIVDPNKAYDKCDHFRNHSFCICY